MASATFDEPGPVPGARAAVPGHRHHGRDDGVDLTAPVRLMWLADDGARSARPVVATRVGF